MSIIRKNNCLCGFITVGDKNYTFEIDFSGNPLSCQGSFKIDWRLKRMLGVSLNRFLENVEFYNPVEFHKKFSDFVKTNVSGEKTEPWLHNPLKMCALVKNLKEEIEEADDFIESIDIETRIVEVKVTDSQLRKHKSVVRLSKNYPREAIEIVNLDLPLQRTDLLESTTDLNNIHSISDFCRKFSKLVNSFQEFWNIIALIDSQCCVLDPANPSFKDVLRRIKLTDTLSATLIFNPFNARQRPSIKLLGCQSEVNRYRMILQKNLENEVWDPEEDLLYNLSNILELSLPDKVSTEKTKDFSDLLETGECAICFTWRLNDEIPNEVCEKTTCRSMYHSTCLFTYLSSVSHNRGYFGKIQGECPNCEEIISCPVPKMA